MYEYRGSLMQGEIESMWSFPQVRWQHDDLAGSVGGAAITDDALSDLELCMALPGAPQNDNPLDSGNVPCMSRDCLFLCLFLVLVLALLML